MKIIARYFSRTSDEAWVLYRFPQSRETMCIKTFKPREPRRDKIVAMTRTME